MPGKADEPSGTSEDEPRGIDEPAIDPFEGHHRFAHHVGRRMIKTWFDRSRVEAIEPLQVQVDRILDLDAIAAHSEWSGTFVSPREMRVDELSLETEQQMEQKERQFILRNLSRKVMFVDPDEPLPLSTEDVERLTMDKAYGEVSDAPLYEPVEMLAEMNLDVVKDEIGLHRWLVSLDWTRHFGREIRDDWTGPMWRYDPDAKESAEGDDTEGEAAAGGAGEAS